MDDSVGKPSENVEDRMFVSGKDVGEVRAIKDVLKSRKNADPNVRSIGIGNESTIQC